MGTIYPTLKYIGMYKSTNIYGN